MALKQRVQDVIGIFLGGWMFVSAPWFGIGSEITSPAWAAYVLGGLVVLVSLWGILQPRYWQEWVNALLGVLIVVAPFVFAFAGQATALWTHVIVGILIVVNAVWGMFQKAAEPAGGASSG